MPLSEHEQRMLEQIENALYAEDPKFASNVRRRRMGGSTARRRLQAAVVFVVGLVLLIGGLVVDFTVGGFPILSLVGFLVMFAAGLFALWGVGSSSTPESAGPTSQPSGGRRARGGPSRKFSERMEERFNRRFEQE
ncbi:DUF3040 domain-containing protein [Williamsia phyllosphaerae]|uniref:DUF3040 domain-containing protein n=1 Tax=Williamsia phyllosphaerae TaxID=885042 RepID=A0ABQ1UZQ7_9NOCA|nr:DUF3040 domain-containing protein [Williamsia phyllosphaerae]GGF29448.1 hypothetical protein GCM10007298_26730 [Williamsia phyllosphaerae]